MHIPLVFKDLLRGSRLHKLYIALIPKWRNLKNGIANSRLVLTASYAWGLMRNSIQNRTTCRNKKPSVHRNLSSFKRVIFIHSKMHFEPTEDRPGRKFYYSGITNGARHIWKSLEGHERFYIDMKHPVQEIPKADLIIGLMCENFKKCAQANPDARKILFLVNCHPLYRARALLREARALGKKIPGAEWVNPNLFLKLRPYADAIIVTGNAFTRQTYIGRGVTEIPVTPIDIGINLDVLAPSPEKRPPNKVRFVYPASHKAIRKGLFRMLQAWERLETLVPAERIELYLVGGDEKSFLGETQTFMARHPNVHNLDWVSDAAQVELFQSSHVVIAPAIEEGQVSAVLEAMACGAVPILTIQCGINLRDSIHGYIIHDFTDAAEIAGYMKKLIDDPAMREKMSRAATELVRIEHRHEDFRRNIRNIIEG